MTWEIALLLAQDGLSTGAIYVLVALGIGRAQIARRNAIRTVLETVSIGIAAALAGVAIGVLIDRFFSG